MGKKHPKLLAAALLAGAGFLAFSSPVPPKPPRDGAAPVPRRAESGCLAVKCHGGIEDIMPRGSEMLGRIEQWGASVGDPAGCVICHGGNPAAVEKEAAHRGAPAALREGAGAQGFYADPGSPWVNEHTCGVCHPDLTQAQWNSLMMTEAGKIQGTAWSFGSLSGYAARWGNYDAENPGDPSARRGTEAYLAYMAALAKKEPGAFPGKLEALPPAPADLDGLAADPTPAVFTYIRNQCERCHLAVRGREERGDFRGMGCSACHIPYGNEGLYEGKDPSIERDKPRRLLVHSIQATREKTVAVHDTTYSGIPVETCTTCHDRGKRIGVTFQGLMESPFTSPFTEGGGGQPALHSKHYIAMQEDIHYQKGMTCQDCHTSNDVHGDGFLCGANLAQVEIECADCHGTPKAFPWELPLGYQDEFGPVPRKGPPRGTAREIPLTFEKGTAYPPEDGYLLTARGNPFPEVVRRGDSVVVHTAAGKDIVMKPLKAHAADGFDTAPRVAMEQIGVHMDKMECYACHASWAPQCYGCHVKIDYSKGRKCFDWVAAGHRHKEAEHAADAGEGGYPTEIPGKLSEQRSYMRFEDPALGVNGEGRITPVAPGCQPVYTVIGPKGETILLNHIFRTTTGSEGAGPEGQLAIDMSPTNPHTSGRARSCESCHLSKKTLGYGIDGGAHTRPLDKPIVVDLMTTEGKILPRSARVQFGAIDGLGADWSRFVDEDGNQLQTVGHHFSLSRPLNDEEREHTSREGLCLSCHREIPEESLAVNFLHHVAEATGAMPHSAGEHASLLHKILLFAAWGQAGGGAVAVLGALAFAGWFLVRRRKRKGRCSEKIPTGS